ncbi:hypothetical protein MGSAQ_001536, partial [marine sediment metagenome]
ILIALFALKGPTINDSLENCPRQVVGNTAR